MLRISGTGALSKRNIQITTQPLADDSGDEESALTSIYSLFGITREILKTKGRKASNFSKVAIVVLNQIVRPFTAKWHKKMLEKAFENEPDCIEFRKELKDLQCDLVKYSKILADFAKVEDMTALMPDDI